MEDFSKILPVTSIKVKRVSKSYDNILAYISIDLANCIAIHDIKLMEVRDRHTKEFKKILVFPSRKLRTNERTETMIYTDIVHPINNEYRKYLENLIFNLYEKEEINE